MAVLFYIFLFLFFMLPLISALRVGLVVLMSSALYIHHTKYNGKPKALLFMTIECSQSVHSIVVIP
jgi:hypothetical protein